ncbi:MAG: glycosyltransferase family 9 protein, partial [Candidatus Rokubacteria bacterium]|nr:glycosyltransferase family 9 protein [Candidatus Rokubacteria bacterium]
VHALPVAATLRARLPGARLTWIVERREAVVLAGHPALDAIVPVDTRGWRGARSLSGLAETAGAVTAVARHLRSARFDVALDLQGLLKSGALAVLTRAPLRIGFTPRRCREPLSAVFTNRRVDPGPAARHVVDQYLTLLEPLGVREAVMEFRLPSDPAAEARADELFTAAGLKPRDRVVVVNPGAGRPDKQWPVEAFAALARRLADEAIAQVLVVWGPGEEAAGRAIVEGAGGGRALLAPPTSVPDLIALLKRTSVLVAADTGPLHLAAALGTPCVGLFGPTRAGRNGPYGARQRTLSGEGGRVAAIGVDAVARTVGELLA